MRGVRGSRQTAGAVSQCRNGAQCGATGGQQCLYMHVWNCGHGMTVDSWLPKETGGKNCEAAKLCSHCHTCTKLAKKLSLWTSTKWQRIQRCIHSYSSGYLTTAQLLPWESKDARHSPSSCFCVYLVLRDFMNETAQNYYGTCNKLQDSAVMEKRRVRRLPPIVLCHWILYSTPEAPGAIQGYWFVAMSPIWASSGAAGRQDIKVGDRNLAQEVICLRSNINKMHVPCTVRVAGATQRPTTQSLSITGSGQTRYST